MSGAEQMRADALARLLGRHSPFSRRSESDDFSPPRRAADGPDLSPYGAEGRRRRTSPDRYESSRSDMSGAEEQMRAEAFARFYGHRSPFSRRSESDDFSPPRRAADGPDLSLYGAEGRRGRWSPDRYESRSRHRRHRNLRERDFEELLFMEMHHPGEFRLPSFLRRYSEREPYHQEPPIRYYVTIGSDVDSDPEETIKQYAISGRRKATFKTSWRQQLLRVLILGFRSADAKAETSKEVELVTNMIAQGKGVEVVDLIRNVSQNGRASKQNRLINALVACIKSEDSATRKEAYGAIQVICSTPTQLFQLVNTIKLSGDSSGWGRGLRRAVCTWYNNYTNNPQRLAMHVTKYRHRHTWRHRDLIRLSHLKPASEEVGFITRYCVKNLKEAEELYVPDGLLEEGSTLAKIVKYLRGVEEAKRCTDIDRAIELINQYDLLREQLNTSILNEPAIWIAMLPKMPLMALIRNLPKMTHLGLFDSPEHVQTVREKLFNVTALKQARVHPFKLLVACRSYMDPDEDSINFRNAKEKPYDINLEILDILEKAFSLSFSILEPINKKILIALDISGSMDASLPDFKLTMREAAIVMCMATLKGEQDMSNCDVMGFYHKLVALPMFKDPSKGIEHLLSETRTMGFGNTDCSKPMTWAHNNKKIYDAFVIYTDNQTNCHKIPPYVALYKYREKMKMPNAKLIVVALNSSATTIALPEDVHMVDLIGFDTDTPAQMAAFLSGEMD